MNTRFGTAELDSLFASITRANEEWLSKAQKVSGIPASVAEEWQAMLIGSPSAWTRFAQATGNVYWQQVNLALGMAGAAPKTEAVDSSAIAKSERRFAAPEWEQYPLFDFIKQSYLLTSKALLQAIEAAQLDGKTKKRLMFYTGQFLDAASPSNYALTNPEVLKLAIETNGESFASGFKNLLQDLDNGRISLSAASPFHVGENLANTPGSVIYENELIQLIQYRPTTSKVKQIPILFVPSVVNKYYILDLTPETSLVRYLVSEGFTVFMISWRNVSRQQQYLTWDDYLQLGVLAAIDVVRETTGQEKVSAVGYCTGGALLSGALAVRAALGDRPVSSMTLLMTMLEFSDPGEIGVFLDPTSVSQFEAKYARGGVVPGRELTMGFSSLRANDLIWSFVVNNYLKGRTPEAFDLFYWNMDDSNLPGPMFSSYVKNCYVENKLVQPNALTMLGTEVDLRVIDLPTYVFAASEDHLVPWKTAYQTVNHIEGELEFVLGGGGHITGPINPVSRNKRSYLAQGRLNTNPEDWQASARSFSGSWWPHWKAWLGERCGKDVSAPKLLGSKKHPEIEPAPGRFVKERSSE